MRKHKILKILSAITAAALLALLAVFPVCAEGYSRSDVGSARDGLIAYFASVYSEGDVSALPAALSTNIGDGSAEWVWLSLRSGGSRDGKTEFASALENLEFNGSATERQRIAMTMIAAGIEDGPLAIADETVGKLGIMSYIYSLPIYDSYGSEAANASVSAILDLKMPGGGWALTGQRYDIDVTAMAVSVLAPHCGDPAVKAAVDEAIVLMSEAQQPTGDYISWGVRNPESGCQVIIAVTACGIDPFTDERFIKNGNNLLDGLMLYATADGGFSHTLGGKTNKTASHQALMALTALQIYPERSFYGFLPEVKDETDPVPSEDETTSSPEDFSSVPPAAESSSPVSSAPSEEPSSAPAPAGNNGGAGRKLLVAAIILGSGGIALAALALFKKLTKKTALIIIAAAVVLAAASFAVDIKTPDEYAAVSDDSREFDFYVTLTLDYGEAGGNHAGDHRVGAYNGESVYDVLRRCASENGFQIDTRGSYVRGIDGVYEFDISPSSGWMYRVNGGTPPMVTAVDYTVSDGDIIIWEYVS